MTFKRIWKKFRLEYDDDVEEQDYLHIKVPLVREFFKYLIFTLTGILIVYTVRYFIKDISPQKYLTLALIIIGVCILLFKQKSEKFLEYLLLIYLLLIIALLTTVYKELLEEETPREAFYMGYAFAMIHRLVGYNIIKFKSIIVLFIVSIALKFPLILNPDTVLIIIVVVLDCVTVLCSFKSERSERLLFDSLYKSQKDILKFKHLLTQYLPNQMVIFANDYSQTLYINNSFKRNFHCQHKVQAKVTMKRFVIEKETIEKNKILFGNIGISYSENKQHPVYLSDFLGSLAKNVNILRDQGVINFPVVEESNEDEVMIDNPPVLSPTHVQVQNRTDRILGVRDPDESRKGIERGTSSRSISSDSILEEGVKRVFRVKVFPLLWDETEAIAMVFDDVTRQRIIMELKIADKNKDLVISMVSHELRTPLNAMLGFLDIVKKDIKQPGTLAYLKACKNSGVLMLNMVNSILDMNQIKDKKLRLIYTQFKVSKFLQDIKSLFEYFSLVKNLYFNIEIAPDVPKKITTDKGRLTQILVNLIGNAFKFTFKGGITVRVESANSSIQKVKFSVLDTGVGISKEDQEKLFKMYGKVEHQDKKTNTSGVGLGLTISNLLAVLLNAPEDKGIQVKSEVDKGSCFSFEIQSQYEETSGIIETSAEDLSEAAFNEERDTTILRRMAAYANASNSKKLEKNVLSQDPASKTKGSLGLNVEDNENKSIKDLLSTSCVEPNIHQASKEVKDMNKEVDNDDLQQQQQLPSNLFDQKILKQEEDIKQDEKPWCLIVDDNPFNLMVACHIMKDRGYQTETALNGQEAITKMKEQENKGYYFKIVLMDCQMPIMDGYEATRRINQMIKNEEVHGCPIVALTANPRDDDHEKLCQEVGMSGHLGKPLQVEDLENILNSLDKI